MLAFIYLLFICLPVYSHGFWDSLDYCSVKCSLPSLHIVRGEHITALGCGFGSVSCFDPLNVSGREKNEEMCPCFCLSCSRSRDQTLGIGLGRRA